MPRKDFQASAERKAAVETKADTVFAALKGKTPAEAAIYIENNVNNMADAKRVLKMMVKVLIVLINKSELKE